MVGDLHSLMYVVGDTSRRARLTLSMPDGWKAASGLEPTRNARVFTGTVELMLDSPLLVGSLREYDFRAGGVPHKIAFWSPPDAPAFDADAIVAHVRKLSEEAIRAFGPPPYPRYAFLFQNGGQAALEHLTSVNLGVERNLADLVQETAHEYIHVWNLMDVRPRERVGVQFRFADPTGVLWWNEGATIMFADILIRRAGLPREPVTRLKRLESEIVRYLSSPGYYTMSAEQVSRGDSHPALLGDSFASTHLQGEVLSTMLDFKIRDVTDGERNVVDVMRVLAQRFDFRHGITNRDIEKAVADVCSCDIDPFFREYIYAAKKIHFDQYLGLIGMRAEIGTAPAAGRDGKPIPDLRVGPLSPEGPLKLRISNPESAWARAGLRTADSLVSINGTPMNTWSDLRKWLLAAKIGDVARVVVIRDGVTKQFDVPVNGYIIPAVSLVELSSATPKQVRLRAAWNNAN
jgi:predicted metalloprotease with PDZ domain